ncbi:helix-turn-helix transcriptional regulator [uncultured Bacteroides sp.]|uniref:helix-turn-helix domain-containing protein n=1 Tax=uncultured Bacteroides sp. TaxID=162156 RepID=UPI0025E82F64|nr:helix-turn-helix transcriptional regulator [uncultured Bacteroides sp.]
MKTTKGNVFFDNLADSLDAAEYARVKSRMCVAAKIADALKQKGMTQRELARLMGKKPSEISRMLTGTMNLTHDTMFDLQQALGIELINVASSGIREVPDINLSVVLKRNSEYSILPEKDFVRTGFLAYSGEVKVVP